MALRRFRPGATTLLAAAVLTLLTALATAQYYWLGQISENERGRLQRALLNAMGGVARDLDNEVAAAIGQLDVEGLVSGVAARGGTTVSQPVKDVLYIQQPTGHDASLRLTRCDVRAWSCSPADWPPEFADLRQEITRVVRSGLSHDAERLSRIVRAANGGQPVIVLPLGEKRGYHRRGRVDASDRKANDHADAAVGVAVVLLNDHWLRSELVPGIVERYFGPTAESDFRVAIVARDSPLDVVYADANTAN